MSVTQFGVNHPLAVKRWRGLLATLFDQESYFTRFTDRGENSIIQELTDLEDEAGDTIKFDLSTRLFGEAIYGDDTAEGNEEKLTFYQDEVSIDQVRHPVSLGGRMSRKRTVHDLRKLGKDRLGEWMAAWKDEAFFSYLSGTLEATNADRIFRRAFAGNRVHAPDADHLMFGGAARAKNQIAANDSDAMSVKLIERAVTKAEMMHSNDVESAQIRPVSVDGEKRLVLVMSPLQEHSLRMNAGEREWAAIEKAAAGAVGHKSKLFQGGMGMVKGAVLHKHHGVRRFRDYGAGANVPAARALLLGRQAGIVAYGDSTKGRTFWREKKADYDNVLNIAAGCICGIKKVRFQDRDFGVIALDTYAPDVE